MLKTRWTDFPQTVKGSLESCLLKTIPDFNAFDLLHFLKGSSNIGYRWTERNEIKETLLRTVSHPRFATSLKEKPELATVIGQYLKYGETKWNLNTLSKTRIAELMVTHFGDKNNITNHKEFSNLLRQMADANLTWSSIPNDLKESCFNGIEYCSPSMNQNEIRNLIAE
jgi:hypothetical protein